MTVGPELVVLAVTIPLLALLFRYVVAERMGTILLSALVAHTAWHWATDRGSVLVNYRFATMTVADLAAFMRLAKVIVGAAFAVWLLKAWLGRLSSEPAKASGLEGEPPGLRGAGRATEG